ncbi:actin filament-associated protein 1-like 2 isoform X2 [Polypterus senegalus]|uniref:actin filament-associated protein 1-like 2 isoform X2 n=1 Tax=Polypterus senegalus TaxID=55291 RepID=UPI0019668C04|nr:actin filament-associated protein 1-like 2 isoform X2 [Polypterus senegalus]
MEKHKVLDQLLVELEEFLKILDKENLSSTAIVKKCLLSELLQKHVKSDGSDEEYIYMNKVVMCGQNQEKHVFDGDGLDDSFGERSLEKHLPAPQKSLPDLPHPKTCIDRDPYPLPKPPSPEGYYEEAQPYDMAANDDGDAVSSSYESYDEEEVTKGKSMTHQWPSTEASIELMKDARICAFLWRKKWLGQWAKQLCVIRENRLLCYKSSKDQNPQLDVNLVGSSVIYKEKQMKKKEHKLKIIPLSGDVIVLGLQSREQTEQWLKVIQEISIKIMDFQEVTPYGLDSPRVNSAKADQNERNSMASESGSSTDSHTETPETKDVKKKYGAGLKLSNLMNIGKKKPSALDSPEKSVDTSGYLNVLVNSQWRSRWCFIKNGHLYFYNDKSKNKTAHQPLSLEGCIVLPDPSPEHLYSFRIMHDGEEMATLEAKSSDEMGHWLGILLSESGTKIDPEDLTYDYVDSHRISAIVNAAKASLYLMQRRYSEPNAYTDNLPAVTCNPDDIYDDVDTPPEMENLHAAYNPEDDPDRIYLDLIPVESYVADSPGRQSPVSTSHMDSDSPQTSANTGSRQLEVSQAFNPSGDAEASQIKSNTRTHSASYKADVDQPSVKTVIKIQTQNQKISFPCTDLQSKPLQTPLELRTPLEGQEKPKLPLQAPIESKLGKSRAEADTRRFSEEKVRLEREKDQLRNMLAQLRKQRREIKDSIAASKESPDLAILEEKLREIDEECKQMESQRVDLELELVEVKGNLRKAESGPVTLGTAVDSVLLESTSLSVRTALSTSPQPAVASSNGETGPVNSASALKNRPLSIMVSAKGNVLQKAKEWEKKAAS